MRTGVFRDPDTGAEVGLSKLGLGCSKVGSFNNPAPMSQIRQVLAHALDLGVTVFDTADIYGQGDSEREIGRAIRGRRDQAFVVTKFGKLFSAKMRLMAPFKPVLKPLVQAMKAGAQVAAQRDGSMAEDFTPTRYAAALDASLRRLGLDHVDAVLMHSPSAATVRQPGVAEALMALKTAGKTGYFGISCDDDACLEAALAVPGLSLLQLPMDVIERAQANGMAKAIADRGIGVFAREVIRLQPSLKPVEAVAAAAARPDVTCVIAGTSSPHHLDALAAACS
ncbi:aldo/keto reductase [Phenylobacterium montanum]|uniref:Aldo/keto reductase n=1 Tax=Phenylobacterium montanum TaxID=2823693 RepID=A0A975IT26_9CAUL|nr:aldo/keto reductase [Caulobacter sp. S6]QUD86039.1 aldo/keto reductase [Caulobacter sp. S6]